MFTTNADFIGTYRELYTIFEIASWQYDHLHHTTADMYITCNLNVTCNDLRNSSASPSGISSFVYEMLACDLFHNSTSRKSQTRQCAKQFLKIQSYNTHNFNYIESTINLCICDLGRYRISVIWFNILQACTTTYKLFVSVISSKISIIIKCN